MKSTTGLVGTMAVTQLELEAYLALKEHLKSLQQQVAGERERLIALVEAGASVEPGRLLLSYITVSQQRLTKAALVALIGEQGYEDLREEVPPTMIRRLTVKERPDRSPMTAWGP